MAKPYSMDLRARAISRVEAGQSVRMVADALSCIPARSPWRVRKTSRPQAI